ncbi:MAG TPA: hypothetical protein VL325_11315 [Pyrinomonadaceae bacterium]|nr:hypothetical protein [Pyrinomonadaceae bacterium]
MDELTPIYDVTKKDLAKGRNLKIAVWSAPVVLAGLPAVIFLFLTIVFGTTPPVAATFFFLGLILTIIGFVGGLAFSGLFAYRYSTWTKDMRERIAADGIKAGEIDWFRNELKTSEKRALREAERSDPLLADAYRETLASRLTATRIIKSSKRELLLSRRRETKLKYLKSQNADRFLEEIKGDIEKISSINKEAKEMLIEAESRLQMIEAAATRGTNLANAELALERLSARTSELPLALEAAKMQEEIRKELETGDYKLEELTASDKADQEGE